MLVDSPATPAALPAVGVHTFLIADVRGYTRFTQEHGDAAAARLAMRFAAIIREALADGDGELLGLQGDGAAVAFGSVRQALRTALTLQERFVKEMASDALLPLHVGIGLDAGEAIAVADGYRGMALNVAARLCAVAPAGEVLVTEALTHLAGALEGLVYLERGRMALKGLAEPAHVLQVLPTPFVAVVAPPAARAAAERLLADLRTRGVACWDTSPVLEAADGAPGLREGVRTCRAILRVGVPQEGQGRAVKAALEVAHLYRRRVITAWIADGAAGADTTAPEIADAIDLRGERYAAALPHLIALLAQMEERPLPATNRDAPMAVTMEAPAVPRNPYKGLRAFQAEDAGDFFGREGLVAELVAAVQETTQSDPPRFLAVVGPSGSGKSSAVLAGLLSRLRHGAGAGSERWVYLDPLVPGSHPLESLAVVLNAALPGSPLSALHADLEASDRGLHLLARRLAREPQGRVVLVVDQAEELFTLTADEEERRQFVDLLVTAATEPRGPLLVLLTLRADFYDRPMNYPELGRLVDAHSIAVLPMGPAELRAAIEEPAALPGVGLRFEGALVGDLLYEVRDQAGALPLLQFTLDQLYERRAGHLLTEAAYRELGGVRGALARQAEATYLSLPDEGCQALARALFLRLIEPGASKQDTTRRRAAFAELELADPAQMARLRDVAEAFIAARLLTTLEIAGVTLLEVSHEALIREWGRLGAWLHEAREDVRLQGRISADAAEWERRGRPEDLLYRGTVLAEAWEWAERNTPSAREAAFLEAAGAAGQRQAAAELERQARELTMARQAAAANRRAATRLRTLVSVLAVFLLAAAGLSTWALGNAQQAKHAQAQAQDSAHAATLARQLALSRQLAAQAAVHVVDHLDLALLLSAQANRIADTVEARGSLLQAVRASQGLVTYLHGHARGVNSMAFSPDGRIMASASDDGTIRLWDVARWQPLGPPLTGHTGMVLSVAFSPDGKILASGSEDQTVRLWDVVHHRPLGPLLPGALGAVESVAFSPDGKTLAAASDDRIIRLWDVAHRRQRGIPLTGHSAAVMSVAFSPDGKTLASGSADGTIRLWNFASGLPVDTGVGHTGVLMGHTGTVASVAFSRDGKMLASGGADKTVRFWDVARQQQIGSALTGPTDAVNSVAFSPDGKTLAAGSWDGTIRLWGVKRRKLLSPPLSGDTEAVWGVTFSPDGKTLLAGTAGKAIQVWNLAAVERLNAPLVGQAAVGSIAVSPDGTTVASSGADGTIHLWNVRRHRSIGVLASGVPSGVNSVAWNPAGTVLASGSGNGTIQLWDVARRRPIGSSFFDTGSSVQTVAFSPDGRVLASGSADGTIDLWDARRRTLLAPHLIGHTGSVASVRFSPDGKILSSASWDGTVRLWDVAHRRALGSPLVHALYPMNGVAFSPNGKILAAAGSDTTVWLWNVARQRLLGAPLSGHMLDVWSVAFSPDGKILASGSRDHTVRLWDVASGQPLGPALTGHSADVTSVAFSPDGKTLVSGSADHTIRLWDVDFASLQSRACRIANRNLTRQEWQQYLPGEPYQKTCPDLP